MPLPRIKLVAVAGERQPSARTLAPDRRQLASAVVSERPHAERRQSVIEHHRILFRQHAAATMELLAGEASTIGTTIAMLDERIHLVARHLAGKDLFRLVKPAGHEATPWTVVDRCKVAIYGALSIAMLAIGWLTLTNILLNSGVFETRLAAGTFSLLPLALPAALESLSAILPSDEARRRHHLCLVACGVLSALCWSVLFVWTYGEGVTLSAAELLNQLVAAGPPAPGSAAVGRAMLVSGLLGEVLVGAAAWLSIEHICDSHRLLEAIPNPARTQPERLLSELSATRASARSELSRVAARQAALVANEAAFVAVALVDFDNAVTSWEHGFKLFRSMTEGLPAAHVPLDAAALEPFGAPHPNHFDFVRNGARS